MDISIIKSDCLWLITVACFIIQPNITYCDAYFFFFVFYSDDYLVVVNAQVMIRDENKGGWVPLGRGGLSRVGLRRRLLRSRCATTESHHEYRIHGILDQSVSLAYYSYRFCLKELDTRMCD